MTAARWVAKSYETGAYYCGDDRDGVAILRDEQSKAVRFDDPEDAEGGAAAFGGKIVRLLTHDEAKRKFAAEALRARAEKMRDAMGCTDMPESYEAGWDAAVEALAKETETEADALWPRKGAKKG